jgi:hypothetical protein
MTPNLDQIVDVVTRGKEAYDLRPYFYDALKSIGAIVYRHEVMSERDFPRRTSIVERKDGKHGQHRRSRTIRPRVMRRK